MEKRAANYGVAVLEKQDGSGCARQVSLEGTQTACRRMRPVTAVYGEALATRTRTSGAEPEGEAAPSAGSAEGHVAGRKGRAHLEKRKNGESPPTQTGSSGKGSGQTPQNGTSGAEQSGKEVPLWTGPSRGTRTHAQIRIIRARISMTRGRPPD